MLSGITLAAKALKPGMLVIAAEPCGSNDAADVAASKRRGQLVADLPKPITIADGLQGKRGKVTTSTSCSQLLLPYHRAYCFTGIEQRLCKSFAPQQCINKQLVRFTVCPLLLCAACSPPGQTYLACCA
jgi:hypothetical protein